MKTCKICGIQKELLEFPKNKLLLDGYRNQCKLCLKDAKALSSKKYRELNSEKLKESSKKWGDNNKDKIKLSGKKWRDNNKEIIDIKGKEYRDNNKEIINIRCKKWRDNNKEHTKEYQKLNSYKRKDREREKMKNPSYRLTVNIRNSIKTAFRENGIIKSTKTINILGCEFINFKSWIESQFMPWMTWDNYGKYNGTFDYGWDVDHIIPLSTIKNMDDVINLNHYTNLQPLCSKINRDIKKDQLEFYL